MLAHHNAKPSEPKNVTEWIIQGSGLQPTSATVVLDSLVDDKTLGKTSVMFWKKYPTLNAGKRPYMRIGYIGDVLPK